MRIRAGSKEVKTKITAAYDKKPRYRTVPEGQSRTKQSFQAEANINNIMKKYDRETLAEQAAMNPGRFLDLPSGIDYQTALNMSINAKAAFDALPGTIRAKFENDAEEFLEFMEDSENEEEIIALGLRDPEGEAVEGETDQAAAHTDALEQSATDDQSSDT